VFCVSSFGCPSGMRSSKEFKLQRNRQKNEICNRIDFTNKFPYVFWYGDLNYRIDQPRDTVIKLTKGSLTESLFCSDQLMKQMTENRAFYGFKEMIIKFWPTYRFLRQIYDSDGNRVYNDEKARIPSWCDRILWKVFPGIDIEPKEYDSVPTIDTSDHVPVFASFNITARISPRILHSIFGKANHSSESIVGSILFTDLKAVIVNSDEATASEDKTKEKKKTTKPSPIVRFHASWLQSKSQTPQSQKTFSPNWSGLEYVVLNVPNKEYFETEHLLCEMFSYNENPVVVRTGKTVQVLGQAVISMRGTTGLFPKQFNEPLINCGGAVGYISGAVHFVFKQKPSNTTHKF